MDWRRQGMQLLGTTLAALGAAGHPWLFPAVFAGAAAWWPLGPRAGRNISESQSLLGAVLAVGAGVGILAAGLLPRSTGMPLLAVLSLAGAAGVAGGRSWRLPRERPLRLAAFGLGYFWFLITLLTTDPGGAVWLAAGMALGCLAAGRLSGEKVELGLPPLGAIVMGVLTLWGPAAGAAMLPLGFGGGLFLVPLAAYLQQRQCGGIWFLNVAGALAGLGTLWAAREFLGWGPGQIRLAAGLLTLAGTVYILTILPDFLIRFTLWMLTHTIYRIRIVAPHHVPARGPALLVSNHISLADGLLVGACLQRFVRFLVFRPYYEARGLRWLFRLMKAIPIEAGNPKLVAQSLEGAREELRNGHVVCIFAEGSVSRTGNLLKFRRGFERILEGLDVPVIPVHLDRLWGSVFSFKDGRFFWKWPQRIPYPVTVSFGRPMPAATAQQVRLAVQELGGRCGGLPAHAARLAAPAVHRAG